MQKMPYTDWTVSKKYDNKIIGMWGQSPMSKIFQKVLLQTANDRIPVIQNHTSMVA